jgi:hypothetical protein
VGLLLNNAGVMVQVVGGWLMHSWGLWYQDVAEVGYIGCAVVMAVG